MEHRGLEPPLVPRGTAEGQPTDASSSRLLTVLSEGLAELDLEPALADPLARLCELLARWAARMNLTGHRTPEAIARRLVLDALAFGETLPERPPASLADLGSGAGFPGLPLAIRWPQTPVTLVEARERRHHFQRAAVRELGLAHVRPRRGRIEALDPAPHAVVVSQALAQAEAAVELMLPWTAPGGWLALARAVDAPSVPAPPEVEDAHVRTYRVPLGGPQRAIWLARRRLEGQRDPGCGT